MVRSDAEPYQAHSESDAAMRFVSQDQEGFAKNIYSKNGKPMENLLQDGHPIFVENSDGKRFVFRAGIVAIEPQFEIVVGTESDFSDFENKNTFKKIKSVKKNNTYKFRSCHYESNEQTRSYITSTTDDPDIIRIDD